MRSITKLAPVVAGPIKRYISRFPDGSIGGYTARLFLDAVAKTFDTPEGAAEWALELSPGYPATIEEV